MLKQRVLTALALIPIVILGILYTRTEFLLVALALLLVLSLWEWTRLCGYENTFQRVCVLILMLLICIIINHVGLRVNPSIWMASIVGFWLIILAHIIYYPRGTQYLSRSSFTILLGMLYVIPAFTVMATFIAEARSILLSVLLIVWAADIGAYFAGKKFGKYKLAPKVSPGKTWEGVFGGLTASSVTTLIIYYVILPSYTFPQNKLAPLYIWISIGVVTAVFSVLGDLFISLLKRIRNLKDTGSLLPGHGGILDRIDGLIAAIPIFYILLLVMQK